MVPASHAPATGGLCFDSETEREKLLTLLLPRQQVCVLTRKNIFELSEEARTYKPPHLPRRLSNAFREEGKLKHIEKADPDTHSKPQ